MALLWSMLWIAVSIKFYDSTPPINAWAVSRFGAVATMENSQIFRALAIVFLALFAHW